MERMLKRFPLKLGENQGCLLSLYLLPIILEIVGRVITHTDHGDINSKERSQSFFIVTWYDFIYRKPLKTLQETSKADKPLQ